MAKQGQIRIIGGQWRSRIIRFNPIKDLRPTPDAVRETLFNWVQGRLTDSVCLDLFAGSGALGFEAASGGAKQVVMVENAAPAVNMLLQSVCELKAKQVVVIKSDVHRFLTSCETKFDMVFIDPPYNSDVIASICQTLVNADLLNPGAHIYIESSKSRLPLPIPASWHIMREKQCGTVHSTLIEL